MRFRGLDARVSDSVNIGVSSRRRSWEASGVKSLSVFA